MERQSEDEFDGTWEEGWDEKKPSKPEEDFDPTEWEWTEVRKVRSLLSEDEFEFDGTWEEGWDEKKPSKPKENSDHPKEEEDSDHPEWESTEIRQVKDRSD